MNLGQKTSGIRRKILLGLLATGLLLLAAVSGGTQDQSPAETSTPTEFLNTLSAQERAWLRDHPVITVAQDTSWPPIEFADERGTPSGMTADYLRLVEGRLGVTFQQVKNLSWQEAYARMQRWEIDMTTTVAVTSERETFWAFTKPYMTIPLVIVTRSDVSYIADLRELEGKKVAVVAGYVAETWIARDFPKIQLVRVQTTQEALAMLQRGDVFACVENMLVVDDFITKFKMSGLKISGSTPYNNAQSMAVRKDWAILAGILDKALDSISATERSVIFRKWLPLQYQSAFDYTRLWPVATILAVVLMGLVTWNWKQAAEIRRRKQAEEALRHTQTLLAQAEKLGRVGAWEFDIATGQQTWTETVYDIHELDSTGQPTVEQGINFYTPASRPVIEQAVRRAVELGEPFDLVLEIITAKGNLRSVHTIGRADLERRKVFGFFQDITERKRAEAKLQREQAFYMDLVNALPAGMYRLSVKPDVRWSADNWRSQVESQDMIDFVSDHFCEITGIDRQELIANPGLIPDRIHPDDSLEFTQKNAAAILSLSTFSWEGRMIVPDKGTTWIRFESIPRALENGEVIWTGIVYDISERWQAEEALRQSRQAALNLMTDAVEARERAEQASKALLESEKTFRSMVESLPLAIYQSTGLDQVSEYINPTMVKLFGYTREEIPTAAQWWPLAYPDEEYRRQISEDWNRRVEHSIATQTPIEPMEVVVTCKDGSLKNISWGFITMGDRNYAFGLNLTERKQAEAGIQGAQALSNTIIDSIPGTFYLLDEHGRYARWNTYQREVILGKPEEQMAGLNALDTIHPEDRALIQARIANVLQDGKDEAVEGRVLLRGGPAFIWMLMTARHMTIAGRPFLVGIGIDITERKQAEEEQLRFLNIIEKSRNEIYVFDENTLQFEFINHGALDNLGYTLPEMKSMTPYDIKPEITEEIFREMIKPLQDGTKERLVFETVHLQKNGKTYPVEVFLQLLKSGDNAFFLAVINDITERKQAEAKQRQLFEQVERDRKALVSVLEDQRLAKNEINRLNRELEEKVRLRTAQLEASNKELEAFSYSVSHDLRAPLRHISGYVDLLSTRFQEALPEKAGHYLNEVKDSAQQMGTLIDDLLQLSRTGRQELRQADLDMSTIVQEVIEKLKPATENRNISWTVAELPRVYGDYALLKQVWINLLDNAVKYTRYKDQATIEVGFTQEADQWEFFVRDNGVGFDMQYAHKLFGVFQRLHSPAQFEGTGIGLANVQRIVLRHGGRVRAEAHPEKGATFYFTLPEKSFAKGGTS